MAFLGVDIDQAVRDATRAWRTTSARRRGPAGGSPGAPADAA